MVGHEILRLVDGPQRVCEAPAHCFLHTHTASSMCATNDCDSKANRDECDSGTTGSAMALPRAIILVGWPKLIIITFHFLLFCFCFCFCSCFCSCFFCLAARAGHGVQAEQGLIDSAKAHVRLHMHGGAGLPSGLSHCLHMVNDSTSVKWASWSPKTVTTLTD